MYFQTRPMGATLYNYGQLERKREAALAVMMQGILDLSVALKLNHRSFQPKILFDLFTSLKINPRKLLKKDRNYA